MRVFMEARGRFALHLRPAEVKAEVERLGVASVCAERDREREVERDNSSAVSLESALSQLTDWGNLERQRDTAPVASVEEYYRARYLYQLTAEGEAAERAIALYEGELEQEGELQVAALDDIQALLGELLELAHVANPDAAKIQLTLGNVVDRFDELTRRAQAFLRSLQRTIDLYELGVEAFLAYKETLIDYLGRFVRELVVTGATIAERLLELEAVGVAPLLEAAAERDLVDALDPSPEDRAQARELWASAWKGLRSWFLSCGDRQPSQAEVLRARARSAIAALLTAVTGINDRRANRSDRVSDLKTLARWFAQADSDGDAHRLWRAAFGLAPARHLRVTKETLDEREERPVSARTSWLSAPPVRISPRLRATGSTRRRGPPKRVVDRSAEKALLAVEAAKQAQELEAARQRLATGRRTRLSDLDELDPSAFQLFLDLLGQALTRKHDPGAIVRTTSTDGSLQLVLEPIGDGATAAIRTREGVLRGPDHWVTIRDALGGDAPAVEPPALVVSQQASALAEVIS